MNGKNKILYVVTQTGGRGLRDQNPSEESEEKNSVCATDMYIYISVTHMGVESMGSEPPPKKKYLVCATKYMYIFLLMPL